MEIKKFDDIDYGIKCKQGSVSFDGYMELYNAANHFFESVLNIEVNEENIKNAKKGMAAIRKKVAIIEDERKRVKNELMQPYEELKFRIETITDILGCADSHIRKQVRKLEEREREEKLQKIKGLFELRNKHYEFTFVSFEDFMTNTYLNKTMSLNKIEELMAQWFEKIKNDLEVIKIQEHSADILAEYIECKDLARSISTVADKKKKIIALKEVVEPIQYTTITLSFENWETKIKALEALDFMGIEYVVIDR